MEQKKDRLFDGLESLADYAIVFPKARLKQDWSGVCWCNPPYGRQIGKWVEKAAKSHATVVMLLPARTDTKWFHDYCLPYGEIEFLRGRLKFGGCEYNAPFPSMVVVFGERKGGDE